MSRKWATMIACGAVFAATLHQWSTASGAPGDHNYTSAHVVQFNAWGGRGNATTGFNVEVADAIITSILNRPSYPYAVSLNEICESQWARIQWILGVNGRNYSSSNSSGYQYSSMPSLGTYSNTTIGNATLHPSCGAWYGNGLMMRGAYTSSGGADWFNSQAPSSSGELRNWNCKSTLMVSVVCNTHLAPGATSYTFAQDTEFRNIALYVSGNGVVAMGDFNYQSSSSLAMVGWLFTAGFMGSDSSNLMMSTSDYGALDRQWRKNPNAWGHNAYISNSPYSDHHWLQGYL